MLLSPATVSDDGCFYCNLCIALLLKYTNKHGLLTYTYNHLDIGLAPTQPVRIPIQYRSPASS